MALTFIGANTTPVYTCLSSDIDINVIEGAVRVGATIFVTDTGEWYIVESDLTIAPYALPISLSGTISVGAVNQGSAGVSRWLVDGSGVTQPVSGTVTANTGLSQPLTDAQLRNTPVPVSGTVTADTGLDQPLTDTQLRTTPVPVSGTVTANTGLSQPLTDAQLRATPVPVSGTVTTLSSQMSVVDSPNSTSTPLLANATFDGEFADLTGYTNISISVKSDVDSATNGLMVHWSTDGINHDADTDVFTVRANSPKQFSFGVTAKYAHVEYLNGASPQGSFILQFMKHVGAPKPSAHRVDDTIVAEDDAELTKSVITGKAPDGTYRNIGTSMDGTLLVGINDIQADAGSRVRISQLTTLGDYKIMGYDRTTTMWSSIGTGTGTWIANKFSMSVLSGQYWIRQTKKFHAYFSGKSQMVEETFYKFAPQTNVTKRVGYFSTVASAPYASTLDGFWLESSGGTLSIKSARAGTSTLNVSMTNWSGYANLAEYKTLSTWDNFTVILWDFLWLGGAVLRMWLKTSNGFVLAHQFNYAGTAEDVFILSPNQPIRYDIVSTTGTGDLTYVCSQVSTEGSINESGASRFIDTGSSLITTASAGTIYPILAVRKISTYRDIPVLLTTVEAMVGSANDTARWTLHLNPTLSAGLTYGSLANSPVEFAAGNGTITVTGAGTVVVGGSLQTGVPLSISQLELNYNAWLGSTIDNVMDALVLCVTPIGGSLTVFGGLGFKIY